jgi:hypothetical protein
VLVVQGVGHSTVTADPSGCAARAVRSWMLGGAVPDTCARTKPLVAPVPALPAAGPVKPKHPVNALKTYAIASKTIKEVEALWLMTVGLSGSSAPIPGIYGGSLQATSARTFTLSHYSIARGVTLTGKLRLTGFGPPLGFDGSVIVGGADATSGVLGLSGASLRGSLGGRFVG